jgi:hypothetical protein
MLKARLSAALLPALLAVLPYASGQQPFADYQSPEVHEAQGEVIVFDFLLDSSLLMREFRGNAAGLESLHGILDDTLAQRRVERVVIAGSASPDGSSSLNDSLALRRAVAVRTYIYWKFPSVPREKVYIFSAGENWQGLKNMIESDSIAPERGLILAVIGLGGDNDMKLQNIKIATAPGTYDYLRTRVLPRMRSAAVCEIYFNESEAIP